MMLEMNEVSYGIDGTRILDNVNLKVGEGEFIGMIGPNGSGKSTSLNCMAGLITPTEGDVTLYDRAITQMARREISQRMGVVKQEQPVNFDFSVWEIVMMGRSPHKQLLEGDTIEDDQIVLSALEQVNCKKMSDRAFRTLSGGEKQRVLIARCLAQQADLILMDEPTNHLDVRFKLQVMDLVSELDVTVFMTLHDLNLAALYCDRIYVIHEGKIHAEGTVYEVMEASLLEEVFGRRAQVEIHPETNRPHVIFFPNGDHVSKDAPGQ